MTLQERLRKGGNLREVAREAAARIDTLEKALPDPTQLRVLADWLDRHDAEIQPHLNEADRDVQRDLRMWAQRIENVLAAKAGSE